MTSETRIERQVLSSGSLRVEVLPELGAKISSLRILPEGEELLQQSLLPYAARSRNMAFEDGDASGIDECIPTVSGCEIDGDKGRLSVPDHGDFWRIPFAWQWEGTELVLEATGFTLPLRFEKRIRLEGNRILLSYRLENTGGVSVPFLWSAHPGFAVDEGDRVHLPASVKNTTVWYSGQSRLGSSGSRHPWPLTIGSDGKQIDLSLAGGPDDGVGDKLFADAPKEGWVALERRRVGCRIEVLFDPVHAPFVGLWLAYGGWPEGRAVRQHCVALEPCTAPVDSLAAAMEQGSSRHLAPGVTTEWKMEIHVIPT
jgi:galactose mutarotase-like enzyme